MKMKIKSTDISCQYCGNVDTLQHFFFECPSVKQLWHEIERRIEILTNRYMKLSIKSILLGFVKRDGLNRNVINEINRLILIAKNTISKVKCLKGRNFLIVLEQELNIRA